MGVALMKPRTRVVVCGRYTLNLLEHRPFPVCDKAEKHVLNDQVQTAAGPYLFLL